MKNILLKNGLRLSYLGEDIESGARPAFFYFALSGDDSLGLDPYNQPAAFLAEHAVRVFSLSLPFHGGEISPNDAVEFWAREIAQNHDIVTEFVNRVKEAFEELKLRGAITPEKTAVLGLSRGAFIACHVAAKIPEIKTILGFAPLTELTFAKEFEAQRNHPLAKQLGLHSLIDQLTEKKVRFYIGNVDTRVSTSLCFSFIHTLAQACQHKGVRSPPIELLIRPSIGYMGHGTSQETFEDGARWLAEELGVL